MGVRNFSNGLYRFLELRVAHPHDASNFARAGAIHQESGYGAVERRERLKIYLRPVTRMRNTGYGHSMLQVLKRA